MAEFCDLCAEDMGFPHSDFEGIGEVTDADGSPWYYTVLCEGCGPIQVTGDGRNVSREFDRQEALRNSAGAGDAPQAR
ncbi:hypothetical protein BcepSauron_368 [Burkholderia phage BcepSauron]|uniref:Uncharacterized protein n=2 Tax=Sarumanvirus TaxID=2843450 RepID=A0A482MM62_9CAUD|nr:hypothetical protein H1O16_gp365 [Burkholderia phage BcepSaruman]YP_009904746.1 hypothetical protein H1O17_gp368 [Burkholderia phage BcepSauron]QBQ74748.1 hypothetical protein BcepSauron_368 [Burkholderia phage BcepSauron]QBX06778.1 hypothetical protein BcepSaruman_365 [Burkholderia phage BcepSaruman]